jgi:hypothetical protein
VEDLGLAGDDLLERRLGDAREPLQRVAHLELLLLELRLVREILEAAAAACGEVSARRLDSLGPRPSTSVASASAWLRLTFVTRARTRSPGRPRRTKTTKPSSRATPLPPYASESTSSSSSPPSSPARPRAAR